MDALQNKKPLSLYIHVPFCVQKCSYCDFCSFPSANDELKARYVRELCRRIELSAADCRDHAVETVYFGGGTPTLLPPSTFSELLGCISAHYALTENAEITSECNPGTVDYAYLSSLRAAGVNRLSVGLQSSNERELRALGRIHTADDFLRCVADARRAGFDDLSADLMFGIPEQTTESFRETLRFVLSVDPEHISAYGLKIEEGTPLWRNADRLSLPDEDAEDEMYRDAVEILGAAGLLRYEISNFAKDGRESRHNYGYWTGREYLGFGVAAHSYFGGARFGNSRDLAAFLCGDDIEESRETIDRETALSEYVMLRMRLEAGVPADEYDALSGARGDFYARFGSRISEFVRGGFIRETDRGFAFTTRGFRVSNYILSELL